MMENDRLNIDKLFRENLSSREIPSADADWADIEKMLNNESRKGGGFWTWVIGSFLLLMCAGAIFIATQKSSNKAALSNQEEPNQFVNSNENKSGSELNGTAVSRIELNTPESINTNALHVEETKVQLPKIESQNDHFIDDDVQSVNSTIHSKGSKNSGDGNKEFSTVISKNESTADLELRSNEAGNKPQSNSLAIEPLQFDLNTANQKAEETSSADKFIGVVGSDNFNHSPYLSLDENPRIGLMSELNTRTKLFLRSDEILKIPNRISALPPLTNWAIGLSLFGGNTASKIEERNEILKKRNQEEKNSFHSGFLLETNYKMGRSQFGLGLGFEKTGENVQYSDEIIRQINYVTTEMQQFEYDVTIVDSVQLDDTTWIVFSIDTTFIDTMYVDIENTKDSLIRDKEITAQNGFTKIQQIFIPLSFRYDVFQFSESVELFLSSSIQMEYVLKRKAAYLDEDTRRLKDIRDFKTYRSVNTTGSLGVGLRLHHSKRLMSTLEIYYRSNLFSWNTDFNHRYTSAGIRLGIGYRF